MLFFPHIQHSPNPLPQVLLILLSSEPLKFSLMCFLLSNTPNLRMILAVSMENALLEKLNISSFWRMSSYTLHLQILCIYKAKLKSIFSFR